MLLPWGTLWSSHVRRSCSASVSDDAYAQQHHKPYITMQQLQLSQQAALLHKCLTNLCATTL